MGFPEELKKLRAKLTEIEERQRDLDEVQLELLKQAYRNRRWLRLAIRLYRALRRSLLPTGRGEPKAPDARTDRGS